MYKLILVPVAFDHGHLGGQGIAVARKLSIPDGHLSLLHVMETIPGYAMTYVPEDRLEANRAEILADLNRLAKNAGGDCSTAVVSGHASRAILDYAEEHDVDCIVIASHKPGLQDYFLGSTAARVVRHAKCGVHVLR